MKRNRTNHYSKPTTLTALLLVLLLLISGCADPSAMAGENVTTTTTAELLPINQVLPEEIKAKIDAAYMDAYDKSLQFDQTGEYTVWYLGTYDDGIVFYKRFERTANVFISYVASLEIADWWLQLYSEDNICMYKDGKVKRVDEAYKSNWISEKNALLILKQYDKLMTKLYNSSENVVPEKWSN